MAMEIDRWHRSEREHERKAIEESETPQPDLYQILLQKDAWTDEEFQMFRLLQERMTLRESPGY